MYSIILPYVVLVFFATLSEIFGASQEVGYVIKTVVAVGMLIYFWKQYKFSFKMSRNTALFAIFAGITIVLIWVGLEGYYEVWGNDRPFIASNGFYLFVRLVGAIIAAPIIEELFTRSFLARYIIDQKWEKVKQGTFTWASFLVTVLFFGMSHNRWLAGIITGIILNIVWYKTKKIEPCIIAHGVANILLAIYVLTTGQYYFW